MVGPIALCVNECTELKTPERVMKVPTMVSQNAPSASASVQSFSDFFRSRTMVEWMKAVAASHGMTDAFSTGSHAQ